MRYVVLPYKRGSKSARALADALGGRVLKLEGSTFRRRPSDVVVNWGSSRPHEHVGGLHMLNPPELVGIASNKLQFFEQLSAVDTTVLPEFWKIAALIPDDRFPIVCRTVLSGHSGQGIVIAESRQELVPAPLYVKYIKKQDEYRVHVGNPNTIILVQRKARRLETATEDVNWQVRNHHNGFVFTRSGFDTPEAVSKAAMDAMRILGLDFGAVDVVYNSRENRAYVLEVNTAPGLEGSTVDDYANYFVGRTTNG